MTSSNTRPAVAARAVAVLLQLFAALLFVAPAAHAEDAADRTLAGDAVCTHCHDQSETKPVLSIYKTRHGVKADTRTPGCQTCHGASVAHVKNEQGTDPRPAVDMSFGAKDGIEPERIVSTCIACHRNGQRAHWAGSRHETAGLPCTACHQVHVHKDRVLTRGEQKDVCFACHKTERAQTHRISTHPLDAGKMDCSDCHNPHGTTGPTLLRKATVNETCFQCHAEKRGPFLWEHQPVTEACTTCHTPHGSNITPLLKARTPFLCQSCHTGDHAAQVNSAANLQSGGVTTANGQFTAAQAAGRAQLGGRNCLACHALVHGSNHPAGAKFTR
jgi:DmsE family decaheme c-type cytochrome